MVDCKLLSTFTIVFYLIVFMILAGDVSTREIPNNNKFANFPEITGVVDDHREIANNCSDIRRSLRRLLQLVDPPGDKINFAPDPPE
ncbi:hypothetical protein I3760_12G014600 [Carya illinoinensis]|uniref:Uncharacterized protein n=1 Tax=Carya illinoinensis TaxID=32201 RepID=A0A8T1NLS0_CARIL|nr:hypothetical protein I3760_12G014600 [Carya illinoinensis]KAG6632956.1 hypothetical protein CIPAW_12G015200 [Carya illinoinensis]